MTIRDRFRSFDDALRADSRLWGIRPDVAWLLLIAPFVVGALIAATVVSRPVYHFLMDEDHVVEWTQFFVILAASVVFLVTGIRAARIGRRRLAVLFFLVAAASFVVAGEEISWGQRLLGFATPESLENVNHQGEANIHNIGVLQRAFNVGELAVGLIGFALPLLWLSEPLRGTLGWVDPILVPPLATVSLFFLPFAYRAFRALLLPEAGERITEYGEWPELTLYAGVLIVGWLLYRRLGRERQASAPA
jgi:hypothetical protein